MKTTIKYLPFAATIALSIFAQFNNYSIDKTKTYALIACGILLVNLVLAIILKIKDYFIYGISITELLGIASLLFIRPLGEIYIHYIITGLYLGLFAVAFFPPLFGMKPFTFVFSAHQYPKAVTQSKQFLKINLVINYVWAALFLLAMVLTNIKYSNSEALQIVLSFSLPIILQLGVGLPASIKLPQFLTNKIESDVMNFTSVKELFESMPLGFNRAHAEDLDAVMQFELTGDEPTKGYFTIKNQKCTYTEGEHEAPTTTIKCDSKLWLDISNGKTSGNLAYMNNEYSVDGDMNLLAKWGYFFTSDTEVTSKQSEHTTSVFKYSHLKPNQIKKVVVFDGGPRDEEYSKTTYFTKQFCEGLKSAGAEIEYIRLKDKNINPCIGCYTCWTKTPGECIYKDDMTELRKKLREANLIVFASPLYIFSVTGILKNFLDRQIPNMMPYLVEGEDGCTLHPDRYPEHGKQGFVVFSAAGFPEVKNNYDGLQALFRTMHSHSQNMKMMGEFYITCAETLTHPVYNNRKQTIIRACYDAGVQAVKKGQIDKSLMEIVTNPGVSFKTFREQANNFWESLDGKNAYLKGVPKL